MKRLIKKSDARKLVPSGLGLDPMMAKAAIEAHVQGPTYGGLKELVMREGTSYSSYGLVSDDGQYIFEAYEFVNNRDEKWCALVVASVDKITAGNITTSDMSVSVFKNDEETYRIGEIEERALSGLSAVDGTSPTFNQRFVEINTTTNE